MILKKRKNKWSCTKTRRDATILSNHDTRPNSITSMVSRDKNDREIDLIKKISTQIK